MTSQTHPQPGSIPSLPQALPDYYSSPVQDSKLGAKFSNIDDRNDYLKHRQKLGAASTKNFVTDVWSDSAWCAVDLDANEIKSLLEARRPSKLENRWIETRWINFWGGDLQTDAVNAVAAHYGLTPRLTALMCARAVQSGLASSAVGPRYALQTDSDSSESPNEKDPDVEAAPVASSGTPAAHQTLKDIDFKEIEFGHIVNEIWHWCSVDWGQRYLCLGYNSLFTIKDVQLDNGLNKPEGKRIWCWLVLCDDGNVISIYENPFPNATPDLAVLRTVRRNVLNVFHHLSKECNKSGQSSSLMTVQIRNFDQPTQPTDGASSTEVASKLLYYLFDDWITTYGLVAKKEHPYGSELEEIRGGMLTVAKVGLVDRLHQIGRRLAVLKRVYQSYEQMITRILQRQRLLRDEARQQAKGQSDSRPVKLSGGRDENEHRPSLFHSPTMLLTTSDDMSLGVRLSSSAIVRFERLLDRIQLYAISEIDECLNEKEALVFMVCFVIPATPFPIADFLQNFNLIQLKEAQAVEKLTRITILLAKATILFLPVSLMTGYFSVQIADLQGVYTVQTYWLCFLVIAILSIVFLIIFGFASDTVEGRTVYKSLWRTFVDFSKAAIGRKRKQKHS